MSYPLGYHRDHESTAVVTPEERVVRGFLRRLENIASRSTVDKMFSDGLDGFVDRQESLFELQMKLQKTIGEVKQRRSKDPDVREHLETLRHLRWRSRQLGDAIAWNGLLHNRQVIESLTGNDAVPIPPRWTNGHRGTFQFARSMTGPEWGVPVVHDITNALRIGDVTFMNPALEPSESVFRTVELKTTRVSEETNENGESILSLTVTAIGNEPFPASHVKPRADGQTDAGVAARTETLEGTATERVRRRRPDRRIESQLARMDIATASKNVPFHRLTKVGDRHVFSLSITDEQEPHWAELRRAIRAARRDGFAYFELGEFVGYSLHYNAAGLSIEDIKNSPVAKHVAGLTHKEIGDRNSITVSRIPGGEEDQSTSKALPFYLWDVPQRAIQDILRHRLMITATYNSGWMEKLLVDAGLTVVPETSARDRRGFEVVASFTWEGEARVEYHSSVWEEMYVAVQEFRGPSAVVQRALAPTAAPSIVGLHEFIPEREDPAEDLR